jgi:putative tryptophan/tyrosine transport system substrate-binding protein
VVSREAHERPIRRPGAALWRAVCVVLASAALAGAKGNRGVVIVTSAAVPAYAEAVHGLTSLLPEATVIELGEAAALAGLRPRLIVAVGSRALEQLADGPVPVIATMVMEGARAGGRKPAGEVSLDVPLATVLGELRRVLPEARRLGILGNPARPGQSRVDLAAEARRQGFTLEFADCGGPKEMLDALASLRSRVDAVWCPPDGSLFNATTVQPLVVASLRHRLPLIGFSESFVRAGAALGIYPDFREAGLQTAELAQRCLDSDTGGVRETARTVRVAINEQVMRLLGLRYKAQRPGDARTVVLR